MSYSDEISKDVAEVEGLVNQTFNWNDHDYPCTPDKFTREIAVDDHGNQIEIVLSLRTRFELFPDHVLPESGDTILFDGEPYKVKRTRSKHFVILWIDCIDPNT